MKEQGRIIEEINKGELRIKKINGHQGASMIFFCEIALYYAIKRLDHGKRSTYTTIGDF